MRRLPASALVILAAMTAIVVLAALASCDDIGAVSTITSNTPGPGPVQESETGHVFDVEPAATTAANQGCAERVTSPSQLPLPDPSINCTPGSFDPSITPAILCPKMQSWWAAERAPSSETHKVKYVIMPQVYHIQVFSDMELDHLIPRELGGTNSVLNLWPEPGGIPNAKDRVENALNDWVCKATGQEALDRLRQAQLAIATNWTTAEQTLGIQQ